MSQLRHLFWTIWILSGSFSFSWAQPGSLITNFGNGGFTTANGTFDQKFASVAVDGENRIVLAGATQGDMYVSRFSSQGDVDLSFGTDGRVTLDFGINDVAEDVFIQSDQKILVAGSTDTLNQADAVIVRLNEDGSLDNSFGVNGVFTFTGVEVFDRFREIALLSDESIIGLLGIGSGSSSASSDDNYENVGLVKVTSGGSLDASFADSGLWRTSWLDLAWDRTADLVIQSDDKIVVPMSLSQAGQGIRVHAWRFDDQGFRDSLSFGEFAGQTDWHYLGNSVSALTSGIGLQSDGSILIAGTFGGFILPEQDFFVWRLTEEGLIDSSFNTEGFVTTDFFGEDDEATDLVMQGDDFLVLGTADSAGSTHLAVARYLADGQLDPTFGQQGKAYFPLGTISSSAKEGALLSDGSLVVAGLIDDQLALMGVANQANPGTFIFPIRKNDISARLFPNPVADIAYLEFSLDRSQRVSVALFDLNGRLVKYLLQAEPRTAGANRVELTFSPDLGAGWYALRIGTAQGITTLPLHLLEN